MWGNCNRCGQDVGVYSMTQKLPELTCEFENVVIVWSVVIGGIIGVIIGFFVGMVI
jgi:hypothetical protein